jgi:AraC family transcriptional regulator
MGEESEDGRPRPSVFRFQTHGARKYPTAELLASSADRGWSTIAAELRSHRASTTPAVVPQHTEICIVIAGNEDGLVRRSGAGLTQRAVPRTGAISLSPIDVGDNEVSISAPIPQVLHLYLPSSLFDRLRGDFNLPAAPGRSIRYLMGIRDELIGQVGRSILSELTSETSVGRMYVESAALTLVARLLCKYCDSGARDYRELDSRPMNTTRIRRILDYVSENISSNITIKSLAEIAGYSEFHFARKFTLAMGISPRRYVSHRRLENAMAELAVGKLSLAEIAFNAQFSSQASFTRAFHRATGTTPKEYQRLRN